VGESGMIRTHMGKHNRSVMVAVHGAPCAIAYRNSKRDSQGYFCDGTRWNTVLEVLSQKNGRRKGIPFFLALV
jgi:hypothetical protein